MFENRAEDPAVAMEVGKLRVLKFLIEFRGSDFLQKVCVGPQATNRRPLGIPRLDFALLFGARMALFGWPHVFAVHFVVPPCVSEIGRDHVRSRMNVADNALAGRDRPRELVANGMSRLVMRNRGIGCNCLAQVSVDSVSAGMFGRTIVRVDNVTRTTSAGAIVARLIVSAGK